MEVTFGVNISYFLWSLLTGGVLALAYDLLRTVRRIIRTSAFGVNLEDILYFLMAGALMFWLAYDKNGGRLRWQGILGTAAGFALYRAVFQDWVVKILVRGYDILVQIFLWILKILLFPVRIVYKILEKPFVIIGWYSRKGARRAGGFLKTRAEKRKIKRKCRRAEAAKRKENRRKQRREEAKKAEDRTKRPAADTRLSKRPEQRAVPGRKERNFSLTKHTL